jgi:DNA modification methylase
MGARVDAVVERTGILNLPYIAEDLRPLAVSIGSVTVDPANVRRHPERNLETIKIALSKYGQRKPIVVNRRTSCIEAGNGTWEAAKALGWEFIAAAFMDDDPTTATGYAIADNRSSELATWDDAALAEVLQSLKQEGELAFTGFDGGELDRLLRDLRPPKEEMFNIVEALQAAADLAEKVKPGQVWRLGQHRLMCGDSTKAADVARLMQGAVADFLFTSPPYNVGVEYESHEDATVPWEQYGTFLRVVIEAWLPVLRVGRAVGWNVGVSPKTHHVRQHTLLESLGLTFVREMVWKKVGVPVPYWYHTLEKARARYFTPNYVHELVWIFSRGTLEVGGPIEVDPLAEFDVFEIAQSQATVDLPPGDQHTGVRSNLDRRSFKAHPSPFPVPLPRLFITHLCDVSEIVVDPFLGSGSTIVAAEQIGRACYGMEIDPLYCAVAIARWEAYAGESAVSE